jgi:hypothetical protein
MITLALMAMIEILPKRKEPFEMAVKVILTNENKQELNSFVAENAGYAALELSSKLSGSVWTLQSGDTISINYIDNEDDNEYNDVFVGFIGKNKRN